MVARWVVWITCFDDPEEEPMHFGPFSSEDDARRWCEDQIHNMAIGYVGKVYWLQDPDAES